MRKLFFLLFIIVFVSCKETNRTKNLSDKSGGELKFDFYMMPRGYSDPIFANNAYQILLLNQITEGLVKTDYKKLEVKPGLAKRWDVNEDKTEYIFHLRTDVNFHTLNNSTYSNQKFTAEDVEYCIKRLCSFSTDNVNYDFAIDKIKGAKSFYEKTRKENFNDVPLEGVEVVNDSTLKITLQRANIGFLDILSSYPFSIYPKGYIPSDSTLIGTGPFKLGAFSKSEILLEKNNTYWAKDEEGKDLPYLDKVVINKSAGLDEMIERFEADKADMIPFAGFWLVDSLLPHLNYSKKGMDLDFEYDYITGYNAYALFFNFQNPALQDVKVRRAINLSIDRNKFLDSVWQGDGKILNCGFSPFCDNEELHPNLQYNPELARKLLAEAGYPNGKGFPILKLPTLRYNIGEFVTIQDMIQENLNITVMIDTMDNEITNVEKGERGQYDLYPMFWYADYYDSETFMRFFYSKFIMNDSISKVNISRFRDDEFDELFETARETERKDNLIKANKRLADLAALVPIASQDNSIIIKKWVKGFSVNFIDVYDFSKVYIKKN